jgi:hypothetical protein
MRRRLSILVLIALLLITSTSGALQEGEPKQYPQAHVLTIYQDQNLALIEDERVLELNKGLLEYSLEGVTAKLLADSVKLEALELPEAIRIIEQRYQSGRISLQRLLEENLGREIEVFAPGGLGTYRGKLIGTEGGIILRDDSGRLQVIQDATRFHFPGAGGPTEPSLTWKLQSEISGPHPVRLSYLSEGFNWRADYTAVLDSEGELLELESWVSVSNNSGLDLEPERLQLVAGLLHRVFDGRKGELRAEAAMAPPAPFVERPVFEYHLYALERKVELPDGETVQLAFLRADSIPMERKYIYESYSWEGVQVWVGFTNADPLEKPLPAGIVRLYQRTSQGLQFIGEDRIPHTPIGERVELFAGLAFDLVVERIQTRRERLGERAWRETFQIKLTNRKEEEVTIRVRERLRGDWKITEKSHDFIQLDAQTIEFRIPLASGGTEVVQYTVEYRL